jgi:hypothetical protein
MVKVLPWQDRRLHLRNRYGLPAFSKALLG